MLEGPQEIRNSGYLVINYPLPGSHGWAVLERSEVTSALDGGLQSRVAEPHLAGRPPCGALVLVRQTNCSVACSMISACAP